MASPFGGTAGIADASEQPTAARDRPVDPVSLELVGMLLDGIQGDLTVRAGADRIRTPFRQRQVAQRCVDLGRDGDLRR